MNVTLRIRAMQKIIDKQNDLIELMYKAEGQAFSIAHVHGFRYAPQLTLDADNLRKEIAELKKQLYEN